MVFALVVLAWVLIGIPVALGVGHALRGVSACYPLVDAAGSPTRTVVEARSGVGGPSGPTGFPPPAATPRR